MPFTPDDILDEVGDSITITRDGAAASGEEIQGTAKDNEKVNSYGYDKFTIAGTHANYTITQATNLPEGNSFTFTINPLSIELSMASKDDGPSKTYGQLDSVVNFNEYLVVTAENGADFDDTIQLTPDDILDEVGDSITITRNDAAMSAEEIIGAPVRCSGNRSV